MAKKIAHSSLVTSSLHGKFLTRIKEYNSLKEQKEKELLNKQLKAALDGRELILGNSRNL